MAIKVVRNEVDGWDVVREDEDSAMSNHATREEAEEAARIRSEEDRVNDVGDEPVVVDTEHVHKLDDTRQGVKPAFLAMAGLLAVVTIILVVLAVTGSLTDFGS